MNTQPRSVIPIFTTRGEAEAFLVYPYLYNRLGEWVGWVTTDRQVYSVLGMYVGELTLEPRIIRKKITATLHPKKDPPPNPGRITIPAHIPLAPLMGDLRFGFDDVLLDQPERLHTIDAGEFREDMD